jgi:flagellin-like hook-associated protein FlgL
MDVDIAAEQANLVTRQVLMEASIAALAQANQMKSSLLSLLR